MSEVDWQGGLVWRFGLPASKSRVADLEDGLPGFGYVGDRITTISRFPKIGTQQPLVFLLKITILGCFGGTTILGSPPFISELPPLRRGPTFARSFRGPYILIYIFLNHVRCLIPPNTFHETVPKKVRNPDLSKLYYDMGKNVREFPYGEKNAWWEYTPPKFNTAPEMSPSQKESSLPTVIFQGLC